MGAVFQAGKIAAPPDSADTDRRTSLKAITERVHGLLKSDYNQNRHGRIVHIHNKVVPKGREQLPAGVVSGGTEEIKALLDGTARGYYAIRYYDVPSDQAKQIKAATGLDVEGFHHRIDVDAIRHIRREHAVGKEDDPALEPITDEDFLAILSIAREPDNIEPGKNAPRKPPSIVFTKRIGDEQLQLEAIVEVRNGRRELALKTLMKRRIKNDPVRRP